MKLVTFTCLVWATVILPGRAGAAVVLVDSFDTPSNEASYSGANFIFAADIEGSEFDNRRLSGAGMSNWTASISGGNFTYSVMLRGSPGLNDRCLLEYTTQTTPLDLMGATHLVLKVASLSGQGSVRLALFNAPDALDPLLPISGTGDIVFSLEELLYPNWNSNPIGLFQLVIIPESPEFSISLAQISLIPEPSGILLLGLAGVIALGRRAQVVGL